MRRSFRCAASAIFAAFSQPYKIERSACLRPFAKRKEGVETAGNSQPGNPWLSDWSRPTKTNHAHHLHVAAPRLFHQDNNNNNYFHFHPQLPSHPQRRVLDIGPLLVFGSGSWPTVNEQEVVSDPRSSFFAVSSLAVVTRPPALT